MELDNGLVESVLLKYYVIGLSTYIVEDPIRIIMTLGGINYNSKSEK